MRHLNVREVAEQLGVAPTTVYAMCQQKLIPHVRIGTGRGAIRISEEALAQYLTTVAVQPVGPAEVRGRGAGTSRERRKS